MNASALQFIRFHSEAMSEAAAIGGKARALAQLANGGFRIPEWFIVLPSAFVLSAERSRLDWRELISQPHQLRAWIEHLALDKEALAEVEAALSRLGSGRGEEAWTTLDSKQVSLLTPAPTKHELRFAVRSSALDEDGAQHSFAGQLESFLFVPASEVPRRIAHVWASGFSERILLYRREHGLAPLPPPPAVLVQRMIDPEAAGVAFGSDPVTGRRGVAVVSAVWGIGSALVSGDADADTWHVARDGRIVSRQIAVKARGQRFSPQSHEGVETFEVEAAQAGTPALTDVQVLAVADLARSAGRHFHRPQDIEWALAGGELYLLQSRPITSLAGLADPDGALNIWDNSNIAESYNGVTTPLTFSFARRVYKEVYRQFCRLMGVSETKIAAHSNTFRRMLGLIRGRIYYNLLSWYRVLALLPGFQVNRRFMEQMMGVKEGLPAGVLSEFNTQPGVAERVRDSLDLARTVLGLMANHLKLESAIERFSARLNDALRAPNPALADLRADELAAHYFELERRLLTRWDAPLVNDFFAMIFFGVLRRLTEKWCDDQDGTLQNDLIAGDGGIISAEPARRVRELAAWAAQTPEFARLLVQGELPQIKAALASQPEFAAKYHEYLAKFGERCLEELKLETSTLLDDPTVLFRAIGQYAARLREPGATTLSSVEGHVRHRAEACVAERIGNRWFRRTLFEWVLRHTRARVKARENLRFERTRVFGRVRQIFVELGRRLQAVDRLESARDIFYLTVEEALGFVDGTTATADLKALVALRKAEFTRYTRESPPADRFETRGVVHQGNRFEGAAETVPTPAGDSLKGLGCCPGLVRGRARVILDPRHAEIQAGEILVAPRTDPGWIMLFPSVAGLLVEYGSLLSHSAIVARELGIPAIVSLTGLTAWVKTGDWLELDGSTGIVRKVEGPKQ